MTKTMKISADIFDKMAKQTDDPFRYIMATVEMGFTALSDKRDIVEAWNKVHPNKKLSLPQKEAIHDTN